MNWPFQYRTYYYAKKSSAFDKALEDVNQKLNLSLKGHHGCTIKHGMFKVDIKTVDGLCGCAIAYDWYIDWISFGLSLATAIQSDEFKQFVEAIKTMASAGGYTKLMISHVQQDFLEVFSKAGFKTIEEFINRRTGSTVAIMTVDIPQWGEK